VVFDATPFVVTVNVPDVAPAATVAVVGTVAAVLPEVSGTVRPPTGAGLLMVTVPVEEAPPRTEVGASDTPVTVGAVTVRVAVAVPAVMVSVLFAATATVDTLNVAVVAPAATVTEAGTVADGSLDERETDWPPVAAGPLMVTVPLDDAPPTSDVGASTTPVTVGAVIARLAVSGVPSLVAVIVADVFAPTGMVVTLNVAVV
jgi:hypothetical protein